MKQIKFGQTSYHNRKFTFFLAFPDLSPLIYLIIPNLYWTPFLSKTELERF